MPHRRGMSSGPGWAAFDRLQRQKDGLETDPNREPFPTLAASKPNTTAGLAGHYRQSKSFSSVAQTSIQSIPLINKHGNNVAHCNLASMEADSAIARLKKLHVWADEDLIRDVLVATNNDDRQACDVLRSMAPLGPDTDQRDPPDSSNFLNDQFSKKENEGMYIDPSVMDDEPEFEGSLLPKHPSSLLVEPEWEEIDDEYLNHRKDAIKMMRAASQHSKAAGKAYTRGDHSSAGQLSAKAQGEWLAAEKLNAEAAKEILRIRNDTNDMWRLDLHGLHASEAVHALKQHLHKIESMQGSSPSEGVSKFMSGSSPPNGNKMRVLAYKQPELKQKMPSNLYVITGTGNHSRGQASLPTTIRTFLIDNEYRFEEARPGVVTVWPKFR